MSKQEQCPPVTLEHLMALQNSLDMNDTFDSTVWVVALICFWACCCLGELTVGSVNLFDPQRHVLRSASFHFRNNVQGDKVIESLHLHLPWTKSTREEGADLAASVHAPLSPADAFRNHLRVNVALLREAIYSPSGLPAAPIPPWSKNGSWHVAMESGRHSDFSYLQATVFVLGVRQNCYWPESHQRW